MCPLAPLLLRFVSAVAQREGAATEVEAVVLETMASLTNAGFPPNEVAAAFNAVEFALRESPRTNLPRGLKFSRRMAQHITYHRVRRIA